MARKADDELMSALRHRTRADDAQASLKPFPMADELAAAEARLAAIEEAIAEQVNADERRRSADEASHALAEAAAEAGAAG